MGQSVVGSQTDGQQRRGPVGASAGLPVRRATSAGGVVHRSRDGEALVVLGWLAGHERWSLPKGTPEEGEALEETALREVREETGLDVALEERLGSVTYWFVSPEDRCRYRKTVHFWLMRDVGGDVSAHDHEFDDVRWFPLDEALRRCTYRNEKHVIRLALDRLQQAPRPRQRSRRPAPDHGT